MAQSQSTPLAQAMAAAQAGERLSPGQAITLLKEAELLELGRLAHAAHMRHNPELVVTFAV
ncbi:MAG: hypothetical protein K9K65_14260, partial [Desulfarculaceae bacterium]|nr:hypothetical protein [Desulfarculaceae bacterium]